MSFFFFNPGCSPKANEITFFVHLDKTNPPYGRPVGWYITAKPREDTSGVESREDDAPITFDYNLRVPEGLIQQYRLTTSKTWRTSYDEASPRDWTLILLNTCLSGAISHKAACLYYDLLRAATDILHPHTSLPCSSMDFWPDPPGGDENNMVLIIQSERWVDLVLQRGIWDVIDYPAYLAKYLDEGVHDARSDSFQP